MHPSFKTDKNLKELQYIAYINTNLKRQRVLWGHSVVCSYILQKYLALLSIFSRKNITMNVIKYIKKLHLY